MVRLCLRQWDGLLGMYAGSDPFGGRNGVGVWRGKFENVRCAALVLAMHRANKAKLSNSSSAGGVHAVLCLLCCACSAVLCYVMLPVQCYAHLQTLQ